MSNEHDKCVSCNCNLITDPYEKHYWHTCSNCGEGECFPCIQSPSIKGRTFLSHKAEHYYCSRCISNSDKCCELLDEERRLNLIVDAANKQVRDNYWELYRFVTSQDGLKGIDKNTMSKITKTQEFVVCDTCSDEQTQDYFRFGGMSQCCLCSKHVCNGCIGDDHGSSFSRELHIQLPDGKPTVKVVFICRQCCHTDPKILGIKKSIEDTNVEIESLMKIKWDTIRKFEGDLFNYITHNDEP